MIVTAPLAFLVLLLGVPRLATTQSLVYGTLDGNVRDEFGRPVADAEIIVRDRVTGARRLLVTSREGLFHAAFLTPSSYDVTIESLGYRPLVYQAVAVRSRGAAKLQARLRSATPPVVAIDTIRGGTVRPAPFSWLTERGYAELAGGGRLATDAATLAITADDRGVEGLPWRYTDAVIDGAGLGAAGAGGMPGRTTTLAALPFAAVAHSTAGGLDWDTEVSGAGVGLASLSRRGGDVMSTRWTVFGGSADLGASFRLDGPLQRDTAQVALGLDYQRSEVPRPAAILADDAQGQALLQTARDVHGTSLDALGLSTPAIAERASAFARLDWDLADRYAISVRGAGSFVRNDELSPSRAGFGTPLEATALQASLNLRTRITARLSSEIRLSGDVFDAEAAASALPATTFAGRGLSIGGTAAEPFDDRRFVPRSSAVLHWDLGSHRLKFGATFASHRFETTGTLGAAPEFRFGDAVDLATLTGSYRAMSGVAQSGSFRMGENAVLVQDAWQVADGFELTLGLRYEAQRLPTRQLRTDASWLAATGLDNGRAQAIRRSLAPRFAIRWELGSRREWTVEGGAGVYHDLPDHLQFAEALALDAARPVRGGVGALSSWPATPDLLTVPDLGNTLTMLGPAYAGPRTRRMALSVARGAGAWSSWFGGVYRFTDHLGRRSDLNLPIAPVGTDQYGRDLHGELSQLGTLLAAMPGSNRRFAGFDAVHSMDVTGFSEYRAALVGVERTFDTGLSVGLQYAFSRTSDNLVDGGRAVLGPQAGTAAVEWGEGTSDLDVPHRMLAAVEWASRPAGGVRVGLLYHLASGAPFTPGFRDGVDADGDGVARDDPAFVDATLPGMDLLLAEWACLRRAASTFARRNSCRTDPTHRLDLRLVVRLRELAMGPLDLVVDALDLTGGTRPIVDHALLLVDRSGTLTTDALTGVTTVPLVVNPNFGGALAERSPGALFRVGMRIGR